VVLEFRDARDSVVRRFSTRPTDERDSLRVQAGLNRFVWDLRAAGAHRFKGLVFWAGGTRGPLVPPGRYTVRLAAGGWSAARPLTVVKDPRVPAAQADLERQFALLVRIRDLKDQLDAVARRARELPAERGAGLARRADSLQARLGAIEEEIYQVRNRSEEDPLNYPIKVNNKLASLAAVVESADAPPTDQAYEVFEQLSAELDRSLGRLRAIVETDVPAFNRAVRELEIPALGVH